MLKVSDKKEVFKKNKRINRKLVAEHENLEKELNKIGVEIKPEYKLSSPLDSVNTVFYNHIDVEN